MLKTLTYSKSKRFFIIALCFGLFLFFTSEIFAAFSFKISSIDPSSVNSKDQEVSVEVLISGLPSESYFRAEWQQTNGSTYFGYSKNNNGDWIKVDTAQNCANYYKISDVATTSATFVTKIGSDNNPENGNYNLKVRRYTSTCSSSSDSEGFNIVLNLPTPMPTPSPSPTPTSTPTLTPRATSTPTPTPIITVRPTVLATLVTSKPTITPTPTSTSSPSLSPTPTATATSTAKVLALETVNNTSTPFPFVAVGLMVIGVGFVAASIWSYNKNRGNDTKKDN